MVTTECRGYLKQIVLMILNCGYTNLRGVTPPKISQDGKLRGKGINLSKKCQKYYEFSLSNHHIVPVWMYSNQVWGEYDEVQGKWTGAVGKVIGGKPSICLVDR